MPRYDYDDNDDYDDIRIDHRRNRDSGAKPQSGLGIASIGIAFVMIIAVPLLMVAAAFTVDANNNNGPPPENDPVAMSIGLGFLLLLGFTLIGLVLGIIGCCQPDRSIVCGLIGSILNALILLGVAMLVCMGIAIGG